MQLCRNIEDMPDMAETSGEKRDHLVDRAIQGLFGDHTLLLAGEYDPNDDPSRSASDDLAEDEDEDDLDEDDEDLDED